MKEQRWELKYEVQNNKGEWIEKVCYPRSEEKKNANLDALKSRATMRLVSCKKMYPFDMWNNQHNFELISNICYNRMHDMESGEIPFDAKEYSRMEILKEKADRLFTMMTGPITWLVWDDLKDAKDIAFRAQNHRIQACIENGRPDLVKFC